MRRIFLYTHGGSYNHGCEAIVRGTMEVLKNNKREKILFSKNVLSEKIYGVDKVIDVLCHCSYDGLNSPKRYFIAVLNKLRMHSLASLVAYRPLLKYVHEGDIGISIGGDMYCYKSYDWIIVLNNQLIKKGVTLFLWGCSIEPEALDENLVSHLKQYKTIFPRERITEEALKGVGLTNVFYTPDPAFLMKSATIVEYDSYFINSSVIGINFSALISHMSGNRIAEEAIKKLIKYILEETMYSIALIPHVNCESNQNINERDYEYLKKITEVMNYDQKRIFLIDKKYNAPQIKYVISQCKFFVGSRTHATIAAYSQGIPTLVIGYSVKSIGIARDLFGNEEKYIVSAQEMDNDSVLVEKMNLLIKNEVNIRKILVEKRKSFQTYYEKAASMFEDIDE